MVLCHKPFADILNNGKKTPRNAFFKNSCIIRLKIRE
nr:MAG TPA: hypothetical protein [Caudoviricetes sp.]